MDLDTNLCFLFIGVSIFLLFGEAKRTNKLVTLRENLVNSDKGWFKEEDFNCKILYIIYLNIFYYILFFS